MPSPDEPAAELYLVRHAESRAAETGRFGDHGLSEHGRAQARALAAALREVPFALCLCSPLRRARETARLLLEGRSVAERVVPSLAEGSVGDLEGLSFEEARRRYPADFRLALSTVPRIAARGRTAPGGESREAFLRRVASAQAAIEETLRGSASPLLVVSHGGLLNYLLQRMLDMPLRDEVPFGFDPCGVARIVRYREPPAFGPFVMLRFLPLTGSAPAVSED